MFYILYSVFYILYVCVLYFIFLCFIFCILYILYFIFLCNVLRRGIIGILRMDHLIVDVGGGETPF